MAESSSEVQKERTEGLLADLVSGALIGERRSPFPYAKESAGWGAACDIRSCAGDYKDAGLPRKGGIESNLYVAQQHQLSSNAVLEGRTQPVRYEWNCFPRSADACARYLAHRDTSHGRKLGECGIQVGSCCAGIGAHPLDGPGAHSCQYLRVVRQQVICFRSASVHREKETHAAFSRSKTHSGRSNSIKGLGRAVALVLFFATA